MYLHLIVPKLRACLQHLRQQAASEAWYVCHTVCASATWHTGSTPIHYIRSASVCQLPFKGDVHRCMPGRLYMPHSNGSQLPAKIAGSSALPDSICDARRACTPARRSHNRTRSRPQACRMQITDTCLPSSPMNRHRQQCCGGDTIQADHSLQV